MEKLYTDASYCEGKSGMAVVAPDWCANLGAQWRRNWDSLRIAFVPEHRAAVFYSSCHCLDISDAEKRAIGMAFLLAHDMMGVVPGLRVEILSDSLAILDKIMSGNTADMMDDPVLRSLCQLWSERRVILTKVRAHNGHWGNELADAWAKRARRELADRVSGQDRKPKRQNSTQREPVQLIKKMTPWGPAPVEPAPYQPQYQGPYRYQPPYPGQPEQW